MSDRDFFREVDEAVRQDRYKELWDKYGVYALIAAGVIVAAVAGFKAWTYWQERKAQEAELVLNNSASMARSHAKSQLSDAAKLYSIV